MPTRIAALVALLLAVPAARADKPYTTACPQQDRNVLTVGRVRALASDACDCASARSPGTYARCVARRVKTAARDGLLPRACRRVVLAFERDGTCGRADAAVCCRAASNGADARPSTRSSAQCTRSGGTACGLCTAGDACAHSVFDACTAGGTCTTAADAGDPAPVHSHLLPSTDVVMGWIRDIVGQGIRRPGYPADDWTIQWAAQHFRDLGLDVRLEPVELLRWVPNRCALAIWPADRPSERTDVPCFAVPYSTPTTGLTGTLTTIGNGAAGNIAVVDNDVIHLPQTVALAFSTDHYDPDGGFATDEQVLPFSFDFQDVMQPAIDSAASAFIGVLEGFPWETDQYYVPYEARQRPIPGVWLSQAHGAQVKAMMAAGPTRAEIVVDAELATVVSSNVIGTLPGASSEWVIIGSHHDGPWASAVEDASGTSMVMAQAFYWSQVPAAERPHNLLFLLNGAHMTGGTGLSTFIADNPDLLSHVVLELHLEHIAREAQGGPNGTLVPTDRPEVRWWFTTRIPDLQQAVKQTIVQEDLRRSIVMAPDGFPPGSELPPTDGGFFVPLGVPIVNLLAAPMYLFDAADTVEMIHQPSLVPVARAAARLVEWTRGRTAAGMRGAVTP